MRVQCRACLADLTPAQKYCPDCFTKCERCDGSGELPPIGPHADGSYITMRDCPTCRGQGHVGRVRNAVSNTKPKGGQS